MVSRLGISWWLVADVVDVVVEKNGKMGKQSEKERAERV